MKRENIIKEGKLIGKIRDNCYYTYRKKEHFMIKFSGFGISNNVLLYLLQSGIGLIVIKYDGVRGQVFYKTNLLDYLLSKKEYNFNGDKQKFLSISEMEEVKKPKGLYSSVTYNGL